MADSEDSFYFGKRALAGHNCCGKPQGCTNMNDGCAYLKHPYKRFVRGEITLVELERLNPQNPRARGVH